ncbi:MAG: FGGY family carbohydrate kinase [Elusimicrobia bacterium]|nr:FGGY family carbohydrate kinase [Elusimicrobiota bacterium]
MSREVVVALDQGSSTSRALAIDSRGRVVARAQQPLRVFYPKAGWVEHDPLELARTQERALDAVLAKLPRATRVLGIGIASQRSTIVFWDRKTGQPAARAPSWQDGRASCVTAPLQGRQAEVFERTGLYLTPYYSAPKIRWFLDNEPSVRRLADEGRLLAAPVSTFLVWRLTKGEVLAADPSLAQRTLLLDLRTLDWDPEMLALFGVPRDVLPSVFSSVGDWGCVAREGRRMPILACLGDQQAAAVGLGAMAPGASVANYGTGAFFLHNTGPVRHRVPGLLSSVGWKLGDQPAVFLQEGTVHAAGASFDWLRRNLGLFKSNADIDRLCRRSRQRIMALPAIGGLGAPRWDYATKTAFFGLTSQTRGADLVRAVAEGVAFLVADIVGALRAAGLRPGAVRASGGLARVASLMQFQSDLLGCEISRCAEREATALGAASLAAQAAGADWAGRLRQGRCDRVFRPAMPAEESGALLAAWAAFVKSQAALSREITLR